MRLGDLMGATGSGHIDYTYPLFILRTVQHDGVKVHYIKVSERNRDLARSLRADGRDVLARAVDPNFTPTDRITYHRIADIEKVLDSAWFANVPVDIIDIDFAEVRGFTDQQLDERVVELWGQKVSASDE